MILGTAGHIDHGKTALVRALTGVDTDRLPEEKRRGITIDLGFAPLVLPNGTTLGVVDVPGHEAFVRTMLAGATGIDIALIVIAADEGPMPQTREHLAILELLGVRDAVVAITKSDLVDEDWLALVTEEIRELLASTPFAKATLMATSTVTQSGIQELKSVLQESASRTPSTDRGGQSALPPRAENDLFRLPIDRSFSVKGTGTVVTGTVWNGTLASDANVRVMPAGMRARVRGLQSHGTSLQSVSPGSRAAIALAGIDAHAITRGQTLITSDDWESTLILRADVTLLAAAPELRPRTRVRFHLATSDVGARVVAAGTPVGAGASRPVRIVLDEPIMARAGDRFVLRSASPLATIGGGIVTDPNAPRRAKPLPKLELSTEGRLSLFVKEAGIRGIPAASLPVRLGVTAAASELLTAHLRQLTAVGSRLYSVSALAESSDSLLKHLRKHHADHPLSPGLPRQDARMRLGVDQLLFDHLVQALVAAKKLDASAAELRIAGRSASLSDAQQQVADDLYATLQQAGREPPSVSELAQRFGPQAHSLLKHLERQQRVVQVETDRYYAPDAVRELLLRLEGRMAGHGELAPTDLRDTLGFSRKFLIPFLEYCDRRGYTVRQGNGRVWRGVTPQQRL